MKYIFLLISFVLLSFPSWSDLAIFTCLKNNDLSCLAQKIKKGHKWKTAVNRNNDTVISLAIKEKNPKAVKMLINAGALVKKSDVVLAMKKFYGVKEIYFQEGMIETQNTVIEKINQPPSIVEQMIYAAASSNNTDAQFSLLSQVLDLFCSKEELSVYLLMVNIKPDLFEQLLSKYDNLFLQGSRLSKFQLKVIVRNLLATKNHHIILNLIMDSYVQPAHEIITIPPTEKNQSNKQKHIENVALAIMEQSRDLLAQIAPRDFVSSIFFNREHHVISQMASRNERVSKFVSLSIGVEKNYDLKVKNYNFWLRVYKSLQQKGDFAGSFAIGLGLIQSAINKDIKEKDLHDLSLLIPDLNYKNYRDAVRERSDGSYLQAAAITSKDLKSLSELELIAQTPKKAINNNVVKFLIKFRKQQELTFQFARGRRIVCDPDIKSALDNLPDVDATTDLLQWKQRYETIVPKKKPTF